MCIHLRKRITGQLSNRLVKLWQAGIRMSELKRSLTAAYMPITKMYILRRIELEFGLLCSWRVFLNSQKQFILIDPRYQMPCKKASAMQCHHFQQLKLRKNLSLHSHIKIWYDCWSRTKPKKTKNYPPNSKMMCCRICAIHHENIQKT